jgi:hypothetical protein
MRSKIAQKQRFLAQVEAFQKRDWTPLCVDIDKRCRKAWSSVFSRWLAFRFVRFHGRDVFSPSEGWRQTGRLRSAALPWTLHFQTWTEVFAILLAEMGTQGVRRIGALHDTRDRKTLLLFSRIKKASEIPGLEWLLEDFAIDSESRDLNSTGLNLHWEYHEGLEKALDRSRARLSELGFCRIVVQLYPYRVSVCSPAQEIDHRSKRSMEVETVQRLLQSPPDNPGKGYYFEASLDGRIEVYRTKTSGGRKRGRPRVSVANPCGPFYSNDPIVAPSFSKILEWVEDALEMNKSQ